MQFLEFYYRNGHKEIGIPFACTEEIVNNLCLGLIIHLFRIICGRQCNKRGKFFRTLRGKMLKINQSSAKRTAKNAKQRTKAKPRKYTMCMGNGWAFSKQYT